MGSRRIESQSAIDHRNHVGVFGDVGVVVSQKSEPLRQLRGAWEPLGHPRPPVTIFRPPLPVPESEVVFDRDESPHPPDPERQRQHKREAQRRYQQNHPERQAQRIQTWRQAQREQPATPDQPSYSERLSAYNRAYYEQKKQDPAWVERRRAQARETMRRKRQAQRGKAEGAEPANQ